MQKPIFNRPQLFIQLLSDSSKVIPIYAMTLNDEFILRTPDALLNGQATLNIIGNCVGNLDVNALLISDVSAILSSIRVASQGNDIGIQVTCPECKTYSNLDIDLSNILSQLSATNWSTPLILDNISLHFKPPTYKEYTEILLSEFKNKKQLYQLSQFENKDDLSDLLLKLLDDQREIKLKFHILCTDSIFTKLSGHVIDKFFIQEWFEQIDITTQEKIENKINNAIKQTQIPDISCSCTSCQHKFSTSLDLDFCNHFRNKLIYQTEDDILSSMNKMASESKQLTEDILKMVWYMRGGLSYTEALNLNNNERTIISKIIQSNLETTKKSGLNFF